MPLRLAGVGLFSKKRAIFTKSGVRFPFEKVFEKFSKKSPKPLDKKRRTIYNSMYDFAV